MDEIKIQVFGRVQGVGFRNFVKTSADELDLKGYAENNEDGSVVVVAQGERDKLLELLNEEQKGSFFSKVEGISYFWKKKNVDYENFTVVKDGSIIEDKAKSLINLGKNVLHIQKNVPNHVVIIPDGNRRWAEERGLSKLEGHKAASSYEKMLVLFEEGKKLGIKYFTLWLFSTENWKREEKEIKNLFDIILKFFRKLRNDCRKNEIKFRHLGRRDRLPKDLVNEIEKLEEATKNYDKFYLQVCVDYGGRDEISRAVNKIIKDGVKELKEDDFKNYLDSAGIPDPDLIIRTSGEHRLSGFMPYQSTYAEFYFPNMYFPDFGPEELRKAVDEFAERRRRRFGK